MAMDYSAQPDVREAALRNELAAVLNSPERPAKARRIRDVCAALGEDPNLYLHDDGTYAESDEAKVDDDRAKFGFDADADADARARADAKAKADQAKATKAEADQVKADAKAEADQAKAEADARRAATATRKAA